MFSSHLDRLKARAEAIRGAILANDGMRTVIADPTFDPSGWHSDPARDAGVNILRHAPRATPWRELDHANAMTSLYAAYERCVLALLTDWASTVLPSLYPRYQDLPDQITGEYLRGICKVLPGIGNMERYQHLSVPVVLRQAADATAGHQPYQLITDAFFTDDQNLRRGRLESLFRGMGLDGVWGWVVNHPRIIDFIDNVRGGGNTADGELREFIQMRNEAAHGTTGNILGIAALLEITEFIARLCEALVEFVRFRAYQHFLTTGRVEQVGVVIEVYRRAWAFVCRMAGCTLRVGDRLTLLGDSSCPTFVLKSLQDNDLPQREVIAASGQELGMGYSRLVREGVRVIRVVPPAPPPPP